MSVVCILTPVVIASWPTLTAAVAAAATSLGYTAVESSIQVACSTQKRSARNAVKLEISRSEVVTDSLDRGQEISVGRDGVVVTFSRDARGKAALQVEGQGRSNEELRALGQELSERVVQKYVHQRLKDEMQARNFMIVEEEVTEDASIHLRIRHWDN